MAVHGDVKEVTVNHPTLGSKVFRPKAGEASTLILGGFQNNDDEAGITSNGDLMITKTRSRGSLEMVVENDQNIRQDQIFLQSLCDSSEAADWTVEHVNGSIYSAQGHHVGPVTADLMAGTMPLKVAVPQWDKIA